MLDEDGLDFVMQRSWSITFECFENCNQSGYLHILLAVVCVVVVVWSFGHITDMSKISIVNSSLDSNKNNHRNSV